MKALTRFIDATDLKYGMQIVTRQTRKKMTTERVKVLRWSKDQRYVFVNEKYRFDRIGTVLVLKG